MRIPGDVNNRFRADVNNRFRGQVNGTSPFPESLFTSRNRFLKRSSSERGAGHGAIQVTDRYWPYERALTGQQAEPLATYISQLKRAFLERHCVRSTFTAADEKIAIELYHDGVAIADVQHAILLGSLRKYVALINNGRGTPITSLRYCTLR
jgi:hypothetical protein